MTSLRMGRLRGPAMAVSLFTCAAALLSARPSEAAPTLRLQLDQRGDFLVIGNTIGHDCGNGTPAPVVGTVGACGMSQGDTASDVFWRSDSPAAGQAEANTSVSAAQARSTAILAVPPGATVTHAFLYFTSTRATADTSITLDRPGGFSATVDALQTFSSATFGTPIHQSVADITTLVQTNGNGAYRVSDLLAESYVNLNDDTQAGGWSMVVLYQNPADPLRNLAIFDGLDIVSNGNSQSATLSGFLVPNAGFDGKLGIITYEGDASITGDALSFNGSVLTNAQNPANNFFNGTRSNLGSAVSVVGDLPQLTGGPGSMSGLDLDVMNVTPQLVAGQTSAPILATSTGDVYALGAFITSISTFLPDFTTSTKTFTDVNGGSLVVGDVVEFTITVTNTGNDSSINTVLTDPLPPGMTYVPGTLIVNGAAVTDALADDVGDYVPATDTIVARLGAGANGLQGGTLPINGSATVVFRAVIDPGASGTLLNQAVIGAAGLLGGPANTWPTGSPAGPGTPTPVPVDECVVNGDCPADAPFCNTTPTPNECVECLTNANCTGLSNTCDPATLTCVCVPTGAETCNGSDDNCDGTIDNITGACTVGLGACQANGNLVCQGGAPTCNATPGTPVLEMCGDAIDSDCDGDPNDGCVDTDGDGLLDNEELAIGTDPNDADSDDDGVADGAEPNLAVDSDGDGLINALDPDSDDDGLFDGTELGLDCSNPATDAAAGTCIADGDAGATVTDPLDADSDDGGVADGSEDVNLNGVVDAGETDPTAGNGEDDDDNEDSDGDGLSNGVEEELGTDPNDADSDDDGVRDGDEPNPAQDADGDGLINPLDADSDNDGLFDGTELGLDCNDPATNAAAGTCTPDGDAGATTTSPLDADTDDGGVSDGSEDTNLNGVVDAGETNPTAGNGADDGSNEDSDGDGLTNGVEDTLGTDPNDADSDDDGVIDGQEPNPSEDPDGDGTINAHDPASDDDGLFDGTELGLDCSNPATDTSENQCVPDADGGATTTSPIDADTDDGGIIDGVEDANQNGAIDDGETDPNDPADDVDCTTDADCGNETSGIVCNDVGECVDGCRGLEGNGCPDGEECTSTDATIGECVPIEEGPCLTDADCGNTTSGRVCAEGQCVDGCRGAGGNGCPTELECSSENTDIGECREPEPDTSLEYQPLGSGFCNCEVPARSKDDTVALLGLAGLAAVVTRRRRRPRAAK